MMEACSSVIQLGWDPFKNRTFLCVFIFSLKENVRKELLVNNIELRDAIDWDADAVGCADDVYSNLQRIHQCSAICLMLTLLLGM